MNKFLSYTGITLSLVATLLFNGCGDDSTGPRTDVIYSEWFSAPAWDTATIFGIRNFSYTRAAPEITQAVLDNGVVLTYAKLLGYTPQVWPTDRVAQLPVAITYVQGNTQVDSWSAQAAPGNLRISFTNNNNIYQTVNTAHQFRYVIIRGGVPVSAAVSPGMNLAHELSYDEISRRYGIPD